MDESGDAPEHPAVRWYRGQSAVEQFTIRLAAGLFGFGVFFAFTGWILGLSDAFFSDGFDKLGWSLIQLGGAITVINLVLHKKAVHEQRTVNLKLKNRIFKKYRLASQVAKLETAASHPQTGNDKRLTISQSLDFDFHDKCLLELLAGLNDPNIELAFEDCNSLIQAEHGLVIALHLYRTLPEKNRHTYAATELKTCIEKVENLLEQLIEHHPGSAIKVQSLRLRTVLQKLRAAYLATVAIDSADPDAP